MSNPECDIGRDLQKIIAAESDMLSQLLPHQKLVLLVGENHIDPYAYKLIQGLLVHHTEKHRPGTNMSIALGLEYSSNLKAFSHNSPVIPWEEDPEGQKKIEYILSLPAPSHAKDFQGMLAICKEHGISTGFNDIAVKYSNHTGIIDQEDETAKDLIKKHKPDLLGKPIHRLRDPRGRFSPDAIALSNLAIIYNTMRQLEHTKAKTHIQQCGTLHVGGASYEGNNFPENESLTAGFREKGFAVLQVFVGCEGLFERTLPSSNSPQRIIINRPQIGLNIRLS